MHTYKELMELQSELQKSKNIVPPSPCAHQGEEKKQNQDREYPSINLEPTLDCRKQGYSGGDRDPLMRDLLN